MKWMLWQWLLSAAFRLSLKKNINLMPAEEIREAGIKRVKPTRLVAVIPVLAFVGLAAYTAFRF